MQEQLRRRRNETFERLVIDGEQYLEVVETIADEYDVAESTIKTDIANMDSWLSELVKFDDDRGEAKLLELKRNRQQMYENADEVDDPMKEANIRQKINKAILTEVEVAQSVGQMQSEPDKVEHEHDFLANFLNDDTDT
jgi:hypothetical protein